MVQHVWPERAVRCADCGCKFIAKRSDAKRCVACQKARKMSRDNDTRRQRKAVHPGRFTAYERTRHALNPGRVAAFYRANPERRRALRAQPHIRAYRNAYERQRRAAKLGARTEFYRDVDIFQRDGWICKLCGDPVDKGLVSGEQMSASVDHVVPLIWGGADCPGNVQLAHWICNVRKGSEHRLRASRLQSCKEALNG